MNDLDNLILSLASEQWQKVAMITARVSSRGIDPGAAAARVLALVKAGKLEA